MDARASLAPLARESAIYGIGMLLVRGLGFLLTPIFTRVLEPDQFGVLDLLQTAALLSSLVLSLRLESAVLRYYDEEDRHTLFSTYLITQTAVGATFLAISAGLIVPVARRWQAIDSPSVVVLVALSVVAGLFYGHALTLLRVERQAARVSAVIATETVLNVALSVALVAGAGWGLHGVFASRALADGLLAAVVLVQRRRVYGRRFSRPLLRRMLRFGTPTLPDGLLSFAAAHIGKVVLARQAPLADVGVLAVVNRLAGPLTLGFQSFRQAWLPYAFSVAKEPAAYQLYAKVLRAYARLSCLIAIALVLVGRELVLVFAGPAYLDARWLLGTVLASAVIGGLPYIFNIGLLLAEKTRYYGLAVLLSSLVTVAGSFAFIPLWGLAGAPVATLLGAITMAGAVLWFSQRIRPMPYDFASLAASVAVVIGLALIGATKFVDTPLPVRLAMLAVIAGFVVRRIPVRDVLQALLARTRT